jgi:hypothetical protein
MGLINKMAILDKVEKLPLWVLISGGAEVDEVGLRNHASEIIAHIYQMICRQQFNSCDLGVAWITGDNEAKIIAPSSWIELANVPSIETLLSNSVSTFSYHDVISSECALTIVTGNLHRELSSIAPANSARGFERVSLLSVAGNDFLDAGYYQISATSESLISKHLLLQDWIEELWHKLRDTKSIQSGHTPLPLSEPLELTEVSTVQKPETPMRRRRTFHQVESLEEKRSSRNMTVEGQFVGDRPFHSEVLARPIQAEGYLSAVFPPDCISGRIQEPEIAHGIFVSVRGYQKRQDGGPRQDSVSMAYRFDSELGHFWMLSLADGVGQYEWSHLYAGWLTQAAQICFSQLELGDLENWESSAAQLIQSIDFWAMNARQKNDAEEREMASTFRFVIVNYFNGSLKCYEVSVGDGVTAIINEAGALLDFDQVEVAPNNSPRTTALPGHLASARVATFFAETPVPIVLMSDGGFNAWNLNGNERFVQALRREFPNEHEIARLIDIDDERDKDDRSIVLVTPWIKSGSTT